MPSVSETFVTVTSVVINVGDDGGRRKDEKGAEGKRLTQTGRFVNKRQRTLHDTRQGVDSLAEQRPTAEEDVEGRVGAVVDVEGRIVHQVRVTVCHSPRCHNSALRLLVVAVEVGEGRDDDTGRDVENCWILVIGE